MEQFQLKWIYWLLKLNVLLAILGSVDEVSSTNSLGQCTPNSMLNKMNRDGKPPKFPLREDLRVKSSYIYKAHEILADGLKQFLNFEEADLGTYLSHIIHSKNNGQLFLDEYGRIIDSYQDVFISIWEQFNETLCENYAVKQLETDSLDLCNVARFLSHQLVDEESETIMKRMGNALKYKCDLCTPYKRGVPGDPDDHSSKTSSTVLWDSICGKKPILVRMRSANKREFFYVSTDPLLSDDRRRRVFTYSDLNDIPGVAGNSWKGEETWLIEPSNSSATSSFLLKNGKQSISTGGYLYVDSSDNHSVYVSNGFPDDNTAKSSLGAFAKWQLMVNSSDNGRLVDFCLPQNKNYELCSPTYVLRNEGYDTDVYLNAEEDDFFEKDGTRLLRNTRLLRETSPWKILPIIPKYWKHPSTTVVWDSICGEEPVLVRIRNVNTTELLFASENDPDERGFRVFTWRDLNDIPCKEGNQWMHEETWWIEPAPQCSASSNVTSSFLLKNAKQKPQPRGYLYVESSNEHQVYVDKDFLDDGLAKLSLGASARWQLLVQSSYNGIMTDFCFHENRNRPMVQVILRNEMHESKFLGANRNSFFALGTDATRRNVYLSNDTELWEIFLVT